MPTTQFDKESIKKSIIGKLQRYNGRTLSDATDQQIYHAVASTVRDQIMQKWVAYREKDKQSDGKRLYYLSVEFLTGRSLHCNILNLCSQDNYQQAFEELGLDWRRIFKEEPEPGLGNGGLGRLAACFMDSLASLTLPAMGCTIRYEYGLFRQRILGGQQVEVPDNWLENGNVWEVPAMEDQCEVHFGGWVEPVEENGRMQYRLRDYYTVEAVPYDMPVAGYDCETVNSLRMWRARSPKTIDLASFSSGQYSKAMQEQELATVISKVLYPEDNHYEGKELRLKQHYFFTSATLQYAIKDFKRRFGNNFMMLPEKVTIHVNDTHPGLAIPELMRLLLDEEHLSWDAAWDIVTRTFNYTNHTVMSEALERWPAQLMEVQLPRIFSILKAINEHFCQKLWSFYPGQWEKIGQMAIVGYDEVRMANLCIAGSGHVNGVSKLHAEILKRDLFRDFYLVEPWKFLGITNGITHRRWLMQANPKLTAAITDAIGEGWKRDMEKLQDLLPFANDREFCKRIGDIKRENKLRFADFIRGRQGVALDPDTLFDVQSKRLHEYKRQLMNILHVIYLYDRLVTDPAFTMPPQTFLFAAKAYPNYRIAKEIILLINKVADMIERNPRAKQVLKVAFLENYSVSAAEILIPAAEVSEQISTAGKEASGTGNMKFMMNGALTIGTLDGANVEMHEVLGDENMFLFGLHADEVEQLKREGYVPQRLYNRDESLRRCLDALRAGFRDGVSYEDLYQRLLFGAGGSAADEYLLLADFRSYCEAEQRMVETYADREQWNRMSVHNIARSGIFAADRAIAEYADNIWHVPHK